MLSFIKIFVATNENTRENSFAQHALPAEANKRYVKNMEKNNRIFILGLKIIGLIIFCFWTSLIIFEKLYLDYNAILGEQYGLTMIIIIIYFYAVFFYGITFLIKGEEK